MIVTTQQLFEQALRQVCRRRLQHQQRRADYGALQGPIWTARPRFIVQIFERRPQYTNKLMLEAMIRSADEIFPDSIFASPRSWRRGDLLRLHRFRVSTARL